jgi:signal recognition particle subunit SRP54
MSPIIFIGKGEHMQDLERFDAQRFVGRLLGEGDFASVIEKLQETLRSSEMMTKSPSEVLLSSGKFTLRDFQIQFSSIYKSGLMGSCIANIPMLGNLLKDQSSADLRIKSWLTILDSMSSEGMLSYVLLDEIK